MKIHFEGEPDRFSRIQAVATSPVERRRPREEPASAAWLVGFWLAAFAVAAAFYGACVWLVLWATGWLS